MDILKSLGITNVTLDYREVGVSLLAPTVLYFSLQVQDPQSIILYSIYCACILYERYALRIALIIRVYPLLIIVFASFSFSSSLTVLGATPPIYWSLFQL
jgi:hypothetical protein